jgi:hypothetical protein
VAYSGSDVIPVQRPLPAQRLIDAAGVIVGTGQQTRNFP